MTKRYRLAVRGVLPALFSVAVLAMTGCEWEGSGSDDSWSGKSDYVNFSGVYRPAAGRNFIVHSFDAPAENGADVDQRTVSDRVIGTGDGVSTVHNGVMAERPIIPGSVSIVAGGYQVTDANGVLSGSGATGNVNYDTGAWSIDFGAALAKGTPIIGAWRYDTDVATAAVPGSAEPIYQFTVQQTGNHISLADNYGQVYQGRLSAVDTGQQSQIAGDRQNIEQIFSFTVEGKSNGTGVRIVGTLRAHQTVFYSRAREFDDAGRMTTDRLEELYRIASFFMEGTWLEASGRTGKIDAMGPANQRIEVIAQ